MPVTLLSSGMMSSRVAVGEVVSTLSEVVRIMPITFPCGHYRQKERHGRWWRSNSRVVQYMLQFEEEEDFLSPLFLHYARLGQAL
jgi:hypothetical protein